MHVGLNWYQDPANILSVGRRYVDKLADFDGARMKQIVIRAEDIAERVLHIAVPPGATGAQKSALKTVIEYGKQKGGKTEVIKVP
jgi:hypothetical protein